MKKIIRILCVALIAILTLTIFSCDFDESKNHLSGGALLDDEMISEIKNEVLSGKDEEDSTESATDVDSSQEGEEESDSGDIVYWTESGSVWHSSASCSHIKNSTKLFAGTVSEAKNAGKSKACSRCCE